MINDTKQSLYNDFNYPCLSRKDLMSLSTITKNDFAFKNIKNRITSNRDWSLNLYNLDIEKAMPNRQSIYTHKIDYINKVDDIEKPRPFKNTMTRPSYSLMNRDIEKAYPSNQYRYTRHTNPLEPVYDFPKEVDPGPFEIPKFIRDTLNISDIDKSRPKKSQMFAPGIRTKIDIIEKSQPKKAYERKVFHDNFFYYDVSKKINRLTRRTNPKWPDHGHYGGDIDKSHPHIGLNQYRLPGTLSCDDIRGTQPGTKNKSNLINTRHLAYSCEDIIGACQGSHKRGLESKRMVNPLNPDYQYLGREELKKDPPKLFDQYPKLLQPMARSQSVSNVISKNAFSIINHIENGKEQDRYNEHNAIEEKKTKDEKPIENDKYNNIDNSTSNSISNNNNNNQIKTNERYERAKGVNWSELPYYEEKPVFESELYKRPNPYYPFKHHKELILTKTKPHTMIRKYGVNYGYNNIFNNNNNPHFNAYSYDQMSQDENNESR